MDVFRIARSSQQLLNRFNVQHMNNKKQMAMSAYKKRSGFCILQCCTSSTVRFVLFLELRFCMMKLLLLGSVGCEFVDTMI